MRNYNKINNYLETIVFNTVKTNKKIEYINLPCGFDIETTSIKIDGIKHAFMYVWMLGIGHKNVFYGRNWGDLLETLSTIKNKLDLSENRRLVVYIHNLGYEFQFFRKYFNWVNVFAVGDRKPIKALCDLGIEFRDSYTLSGYSLENTARNLTNHKIKKLIGNLDYSLIRHEKTKLTKTELEYCENDILIITAYISEQIEIYKDISKIPLTNTGRVRNYVRNECYYSNTNHRKSSKSKYFRYRTIMNDLTLDINTYLQLKRSFMGGFTHANANYSGIKLKKVSSIDFTSSYPSVMVSEKFPMSRFKEIEVESLKHLDELCLKYSLVFDVKFINIISSIDNENYISESKCSKISKPIINNGRIVSANDLIITITDVDYEIIKKVYKWDDILITNCKKAHKNYLPKSIIESILKIYQDKTELKDVEGYEIEYLLSKGMLNSVYGMCVTDIVKDNHIYDDEWGLEKVSFDEEIEKYNISKNRFLYYPWGVWITAYARRNLWSGILHLKKDYVYSDTDSIKLLNYEDNLDYISWFNDLIIKKMLKMCDYYDINPKLLSPKTNEGLIKKLGVWDFEGTHDDFKTLGAKRYLTNTNGNLKLTVAGLSKQNGINHLIETCEGDIEKIFEMFNDNLHIPSDKTGKMTHTYIDLEASIKVEDYLGEILNVNYLSAIHLESCEFSLSINDNYKTFLENLSNGYIYKGVRHI